MSNSKSSKRNMSGRLLILSTDGSELIRITPAPTSVLPRWRLTFRDCDRLIVVTTDELFCPCKLASAALDRHNVWIRLDRRTDWLTQLTRAINRQSECDIAQPDDRG